MNIFIKIGNGLDAFKSGFNGSNIPYYARLDDGTHSYNYETQRFGLFGLFGSEFGKPVENLKYYYENVFFFQSCVNLYADFASQVKINEVDEKGNVIENSEYVKFLSEPNGFQNGTDFIKEMIINTIVSGASFQYGNYFKNGNLRSSPQLFNLDYNQLAFPKIKNRYTLTRKDIRELVLKEYLAENQVRNVSMYEVAYFYDNIAKNGYGKDGYDATGFLKPLSRVFSMLSSLNTLLKSQSSMEYMAGNNVNKVLSKELVGGANAIAPLPSDQKNDAELKINGRGKYGMRADKFGDTVVVNEALKALDLTRDNRKMQMIEIQENAKDNIRNTLNIPEDFYGSSTYENKQFSEARFILGNVKVLTDNWLTELVNKTPGYFEVKKTRLIGTYDHIPSISETKKKLENDGVLARAKAVDAIIVAYGKMKEIEPTIKWDDFLIKHQFNEYLKVS